MKTTLGKGFPVIQAKNPNYSPTDDEYESVTTFTQFADSHESYVPLNKRVIFQGFSFVIPLFEDEDEPGLYTQVIPKLKHLHDIGITDFWWPPPYKQLSLNAYKEGYAVTDRYDVGEFNQDGMTRTKYGTKEQLETVLAYAHSKGLRNMCDIVPNQMFFSSMTVAPCTWFSDQNNLSDMLAYNNSFPTSKNQTVTQSRPVCALNATWASGGGLGQQKYGLIPQFERWHVNALCQSNGNTTISNGAGTGMYCVLRDANFIPYRFYGNNDSRNYLPDWLQSAYDANNYITIQSTDTFLLINQGWIDYIHFVPYAVYYQEEYTESLNSNLYPKAENLGVASVGRNLTYSTTGFLSDMRGGNYYGNTLSVSIQGERFLDYLKRLPIDQSISTSSSDEEVISWIKNHVGSEVGKQMSVWVGLQPGYGGVSVINDGYQRSWIAFNQNASDDFDTVMTMFQMDILTRDDYGSLSSNIEGEMLLGTDINNENVDVLYDTVNWQKFLLNLGYDGFRFDAAGWYSNKILINSAILMSNLYGKDMVNHLSVLEHYGDDQTTNFLENHTSDQDESTYNVTQTGFNDHTANNVDLGYGGYMSHPQLSYDVSIYYGLNNTVFNGFEGATLLYYFQGSAGGARGSWAGDLPLVYDKTLLPSTKNIWIGGQFRGLSTENVVNPLNWSLCNNHDMELSNQIKLYSTNDGSDNGTLLGLANSCEQYCLDRRIRNKKKAHKNIVMAYAMMCMNDYTVPTVYYGDMYDPHLPYMEQKSPYYAGIELVLKIRQRYMLGYQFNEFYVANLETDDDNQNSIRPMDAAAIIRFGDTRDTGAVLVISTRESISFTITVPFSWRHSNQTLKNVFAIGEEYVSTDKAGNFEVYVNPENTPITQGYMSLWIPI